jgi:ribosomal protein S18 acetylase RimI-like enzyme
VTFTVRLATSDDKDTIIRMIKQAAEWLKAQKNIDQWSTPWPNEPERDDRIVRGLCGGHTWIVDDDDACKSSDYLPAATITCRSEANVKLWKEQELDEHAVYVSRLIVNREYAGQKMGKELLAWAGKWAAKQYDAQWIRIDVWTTNVALQGYYQHNGFEFVRFCDDVDYPSAALFQRRTNGLASVETPRLTLIPHMLEPFRRIDIQARTSEVSSSHGLLSTPMSANLAFPYVNRPRHYMPPLRHRCLRTAPKRLLSVCASATRRSLARCCHRLLEVEYVACGFRHSRRKALEGNSPRALEADALEIAFPAARDHTT